MRSSKHGDACFPVCALAKQPGCVHAPFDIGLLLPCLTSVQSKMQVGVVPRSTLLSYLVLPSAFQSFLAGLCLRLGPCSLSGVKGRGLHTRGVCRCLPFPGTSACHMRRYPMTSDCLRASHHALKQKGWALVNDLRMLQRLCYPFKHPPGRACFGKRAAISVAAARIGRWEGTASSVLSQ